MSVMPSQGRRVTVGLWKCNPMAMKTGQRVSLIQKLSNGLGWMTSVELQAFA